MRNWRLGFITIYELMMKLCSSGKPLMNLWKLVCSGGRVWSKTVDLPWRCVVGVRMMDEKAVEALRFVSLIDLSCQESSSWKPISLIRAIRFWFVYIWWHNINGIMLPRINTFICEICFPHYMIVLEENFHVWKNIGYHKIKLAHLVCACIVWCGTSLWWLHFQKS